MFADVNIKKVHALRDEKKELWGDKYKDKVHAFRWSLEQSFFKGSDTLAQVADGIAIQLIRQFCEKDAEYEIPMIIEILCCAFADVWDNLEDA